VRDEDGEGITGLGMEDIEITADVYLIQKSEYNSLLRPMSAGGYFLLRIC